MLSGLIFLFIINASAKPGDIVTTARQLFMEEGRKESLDYLEESLRNAEKSKRKELLEEGERLATRFKLDESQREFELGESLYFSNKKGAFEHYVLAGKQEAENIQIHYAKLRYHLKAGSCSLAKKQLLGLKKVWRHSRLMPYYRLRVRECEGESLSIDKVKGLKDDPRLGPYKTKLLIQALVEKGRGKEALGLSKNLSTVETSFSEIYYWLFRAGELEAGGRLAHLRKYLKLCQSYGGVERRSFKLEPLLCSRAKEARVLVQKRESGGV